MDSYFIIILNKANYKRKRNEKKKNFIKKKNTTNIITKLYTHVILSLKKKALELNSKNETN